MQMNAVVVGGGTMGADIDLAVRFGFGFRYIAVGPMLQRDHAGLDVHCSAAATIYPDLAHAATACCKARSH